MNLTIRGRLVRLSGDGEYVAAPIALEGCLVHDEDFGWVLEFVLPVSPDLPGESSMLIGIDELFGNYFSPSVCLRDAKAT
jgi:hypothetical protein